MSGPSVADIPTTWDDVANYIRTQYAVEKEWPGRGFIFLEKGAVGQHRLFLARNNPGWGGVDHVTLEASLGPAEQVNLPAAAQCASKLMGGLVCADGTATLRESRCLSTLSLDHLNMTIGYLVGALEGYLLVTSQNSTGY